MARKAATTTKDTKATTKAAAVKPTVKKPAAKASTHPSWQDMIKVCIFSSPHGRYRGGIPLPLSLSFIAVDVVKGYRLTIRVEGTRSSSNGGYASWCSHLR